MAEQVLDTLSFIFTADTSDLEQKSSKALSSLREAVNSFATGDVKQLQQGFGNFLSTLRNGFGGLLSSVVAPVAGMLSAGAMINSMTADLSRLNEMSKKLGVSAESISTWENAFAAAGASTQKVQVLFESLSGSMQMAAYRGRGVIQRLVDQGLVPSFKDAGGELKNVEDYVIELSDTLAGMDETKAAGIMRQLGFSDADSMDFLRQGSEGIRAALMQGRAQGVVTADDVKRAKDFEAALGRISHAVKRAVLPVFTTIAPVLEKVANGVTLISQHAAVLIPVITGLAAKMTLALLPAITKTGKALLANPLTWFIAGLVALGLIIEDFVVWMNDGKSAFGDFYESIFSDSKNVKKVFDDLVVSVGDWKHKMLVVLGAFGIAWVGSMFGPVGTAIGAIIALIWLIYDNWDEICDAVSKLWDGFCTLLGTILQGAIDIIKGIWDDGLAMLEVALGPLLEGWNALCAGLAPVWDSAIAGLKSAWDGFKNWIMSGVDSILKRITGFTDDIKAAAKKVKEFFGFGDDSDEEKADQKAGSSKSFANAAWNTLDSAVMPDRDATPSMQPAQMYANTNNRVVTQNNEVQTNVTIQGKASAEDYNRARETAAGINADCVDACNDSWFGAE